MSDMNGAKNWSLRMLIRGSGRVLRSRRLAWAKSLCWSRICVPHLSWRPIEVVSETVDGDRFFTRPTDFVENRLCFFGIWEPAITELFRRLVRPGDVVIDVGANVGYYSLLAAGQVGESGKVFALEPSPTIRGRLQRNLELNRVNNVEVLPFGAWHESGDGSLAIVAGNEGSSTLSPLTSSVRSEVIALRRLDEVVLQKFHSRVRILKVDVEGAEWSALRGAEAILATATEAAVVCEITPDRLASLGGSPQTVVDYLTARGFSAYRIENDYAPEAYLSGFRGLRLGPLTDVPESPCDLIFVRSLDSKLLECVTASEAT